MIRPSVQTQPRTAAQRCPYPRCGRPGAAVASRGVHVCDHCRRPAAACQHHAAGGGVCGVLNRPTAGYCRRCGTPLPTDWFARATADGFEGDLGLVANLRPADWNVSLADLGPGADRAPVVELEAAGGWLAAARADGSVLLIDPFGDRPHVFQVGDGPPARGRPAAGSWSVAATGPWLTAFTPDGFQVTHLGTVTADLFPWLFAWEGNGRDHLLAPPVVVPRPSGEAVLTWVSAGAADGPRFHAVDLHATGPAAAPAVVPVAALGLGGPAGPVGAVPVPVPGPDADPSLLVVAGGAAARLTFPAGGGVELAATCALPGAAGGDAGSRFGGVPRVCFLPTGHPGDDLLGFAALPAGDHWGLLVLPVRTASLGVGSHTVRDGGTPLGVGRVRGQDVFLTFDGQRLKAVDIVHQAHPVRELQVVHRVMSARVVGRLLTFTAVQNDQNHCVGVVDVEAQASLDWWVADPGVVPVRPAVAGPYVFGVGRGGRDAGHLTRRAVELADLAVAVDDHSPGDV